MDEVSKSFTSKEIKELISTYFIQGIPFAFKENPVVFEEMKGWMADRLRINSQEITVIGSSRLGFSLSHEKYGSTLFHISCYCLLKFDLLNNNKALCLLSTFEVLNSNSKFSVTKPSL
jgi:hypothetical protein